MSFDQRRGSTLNEDTNNDDGTSAFILTTIILFITTATACRETQNPNKAMLLARCIERPMLLRKELPTVRIYRSLKGTIFFFGWKCGVLVTDKQHGALSSGARSPPHHKQYIMSARHTFLSVNIRDSSQK
jgi:hypothetical protein